MFTLKEAATRALGHVRVARSARPGDPCRVDAPIRRNSMEAGTFEEAFFAVPVRGETDRMLRTARAALDTGRRLRRAERSEGRSLSAIERRIAALTAGAIRVYEELCTLARLNRGRVFPSYDHLSEATALGRATVARALAALEAAGFLVRQRRFRRIAGDGSGPRYKQTSNVYRPVLPQRLLGHLPRWLRPAPVPVDACQHADETASDVTRMRAGLTCREVAEATMGGELGRMLARLGTAIDRHLQDPRRESHGDPESLLNLFDQRVAGTNPTDRPGHIWENRFTKELTGRFGRTQV